MARTTSIDKLLKNRFPDKSPEEIKALQEAYNEASKNALDNKWYKINWYFLIFLKSQKLKLDIILEDQAAQKVIEARRLFAAIALRIYAPECFIIGFVQRRKLAEVLAGIYNIDQPEYINLIIEESISWVNVNKQGYRDKVQELAPHLVKLKRGEDFKPHMKS